MRPVQRPKAPVITCKTYQSYLTPLLNAQNTLDLVKLDDGLERQNVLNRHRRTQFKVANIALRLYIEGHQTLQEVLDQSKIKLPNTINNFMVRTFP